MFNAPKIPTTTRRRRRGLVAVALGLSLIAASCGSGDDSDQAASAEAAGGQVSTAQTSIGEVLVDPGGLTLYAFLDDVEGVSTCFDSCATAWPPASGDLAAADAVLSSVVFDSISRPDGTNQLRVGGRWPLYSFAGDAAVGEVNGQESAGVWFAVAADGTLIGVDGEASEPAAVEDEDGAVPTAEAVETELGAVLTSNEGLTLYAFANDVASASNCNDPCDVTWPPVTSIDDVSPEIEGLSLISRDDGSEMVALNGQPLYTYIDDISPGDVNGQGVGNVWFAVSADGEILTPPSIRIGSTDSGDVLIDDAGFALYVFINDTEDTSACLDPCISTWPAVAGDTRIDATLEADQFGQFSRPDGIAQLTFHGKPVYTFVGDDNPGDTNGIAVGTPGTWSVISADEVEINPDVQSSAPASLAPATTSADIKVGNTDLGEVLTTADGLTLYGFLNDSATESACSDACADAWPPIPGGAAFDGDIAVSVTAIERADGSSQTVVGEWPVYTFAGDGGPGDVNGQASGDVWFAIAPDGTLIR